MSDEINIEGSFNIGIQGVSGGSTVEVTQILAKSYEYNDLLDKLKTKQELFDLIPEENIEKRLQLSKEINELNEIFEQFKRDVLALAETFDKIEINTDRLRRAKEFFDKGDIGEARAVLEMELEQMKDEQTQLLKEKEHYEKDVLPNLINNSEEFYLLAMVTQTNYDNPHRFEDTCGYFETSIRSSASKENILQYAKFLQTHYILEKAENYYNQFLEIFSNITSEERGIVLNNLGVLYENQNDYDNALKNYQEALSQFNSLTNYSQTSLPHKASVLRNLAILHRDYPKDIQLWINNNSAENSTKLFVQAINIYETLIKFEDSNKFLPFLAATINSYAKLLRKKGDYKNALKECEKSLKIRKKLAENNPNVSLKDVASSLKRLADLHSEYRQFHLALKEYNQVILIREQLVRENPQTYSHHLASTLCSLAKLYESQGLYDKAAKNYRKALKIYSYKAKESPKAFSTIRDKIHLMLFNLNNVGYSSQMIFDIKKSKSIILFNLQKYNDDDCSAEPFE